MYEIKWKAKYQLKLCKNTYLRTSNRQMLCELVSALWVMKHYTISFILKENLPKRKPREMKIVISQ